jgi:hypothetical protein
MCPPSCTTNLDCNPCRTAGDPANYCCLSGLCIYMSGMCPDSPPPPPPGGMGDGGMGMTDGGVPMDGTGGMDAGGDTGGLDGSAG